VEVSRDYEDLFKTLNAYKIKYLVVGAHAVIYYSEPRYTKDIDIWIPADLNEPQKVYEALKKFGAPLTHISPQDFSDQQMILQIGVPPVRIDILISVPGVLSHVSWKNRKKTLYGKTPIYVLGIKELIASKKKAGRPQDKLDMAKLMDQLKRHKKRK